MRRTRRPSRLDCFHARHRTPEPCRRNLQATSLREDNCVTALCASVEDLAASVRAFANGTLEQQRDAVGSGPVYFVHLLDRGVSKFGISKFCAFAYVPLADYRTSAFTTRKTATKPSYISRRLQAWSGSHLRVRRGRFDELSTSSGGHSRHPSSMCSPSRPMRSMRALHRAPGTGKAARR